MITDTRKKIIELMEPYMDKTLSFGCYYYPEVWKKYWEPKPSELKKYISKKWEEPVIVKILWHYDITAVLKYISDKVWNRNIRYMWITQYEILLQDTRQEMYINIWLRNKPLHLYTEQEDKALLELLTKLK